MDAWMDGRMDGQMDGRTDGQTLLYNYEDLKSPQHTSRKTKISQFGSQRYAHRG